MNWLVPLPVVLPLLGAGLKLGLGYRLRLQATISVSVLSAVLLASVALLVITDLYGPQVVHIGGWAAPIGIVLVADRLAALLLTVSAAVTLCVLLYSIGQGIADADRKSPLAVFYPTYLILVAGVSNAFLAGDLFNLYVGFELLLVASYVLLTLGGTEERIQAGASYVVTNILASVIFLSAIGLVYAATGTLNFAHLSERLDALPPGVRLTLNIMVLMGFAIKAAIFPLSAWLPDSYPTAPAQVTAVFAGLLTKVGIYAIIRTETLLFPVRMTTDTLLLVGAMLTMVIAIFGAIAQTDIKRLLSFTLVSHIGYLVFGVALGSRIGMASAIFYAVHHIVVQTTLFLVTGLVERRGGSTSFDRLRGLSKVAPLLGVLFFVPALNLAGIPPLSGFLGKLGLLQAGVADGRGLAYILVGTSVATSLLTLYAIAKVWNHVFWGEPSQGLQATTDARPSTTSATRSGERADLADSTSLEPVNSIPPGPTVGTTTGPTPGTGPAPSTRLPTMMVAATTVLVVLGLALTFVGGPLFDYSERAATELLHRDGYTTAVFEGGER